MKGFTYVELLLSLMVVTLITFTLPSLLTTLNNIELHDDNYDFDVFILDIGKTYEDSDSIDVVNSKRVNFKSENRVVSYYFSSNRLIKSIDNSGFVTLMYNVRTFDVTTSNDRVIIKIEGVQDEELEFKGRGIL